MWLQGFCCFYLKALLKEFNKKNLCKILVKRKSFVTDNEMFLKILAVIPFRITIKTTCRSLTIQFLYNLKAILKVTVCC